jgi:hypothetical protein
VLKYKKSSFSLQFHGNRNFIFVYFNVVEILISTTEVNPFHAIHERGSLSQLFYLFLNTLLRHQLQRHRNFLLHFLPLQHISPSLHSQLTNLLRLLSNSRKTGVRPQLINASPYRGSDPNILVKLESFHPCNILWVFNTV